MHAELKQRVLLEEACTKAESRETLEAPKVFIQDDAPVIDDEAFGRACQNKVSMEECLPRLEDDRPNLDKRMSQRISKLTPCIGYPLRTSAETGRR